MRLELDIVQPHRNGREPLKENRAAALLLIAMAASFFACGDEASEGDEAPAPVEANPDIVGVWRMETEVTDTIDMWISISSDGWLDQYIVEQSVSTLQLICTLATAWSTDGEIFQLQAPTIDSLERDGTIEDPGTITVVTRNDDVRVTGHFHDQRRRTDTFTTRLTDLPGSCEGLE